MTGPTKLLSGQIREALIACHWCSLVGMSNIKLVLCGILLVLLSVPACQSGAPPGRPVVALELEVKANRLDGCTDCGCRARGALELRGREKWWFAFGLVAPSEGGGWTAVGAPIHCGPGTFNRVSAAFHESVGVPAVILDMSATVATADEGWFDLKTSDRIRTITGFDQRRNPSYSVSKRHRTLSFDGSEEMVLPVYLADGAGREAFRADEVLLNLRANVLYRAPTISYGSISVSADVPGAEVHIDGGLTGRVAEGRPIVIENISAGAHTVLVRDFAGRSAERRVEVKSGEITRVALDVLELKSAAASNSLVTISANPQGYDEYWRTGDGAMMVRIPAGEFLMGSDKPRAPEDEKPQHRVTLSEFLIDKTEVTWRQYRKFAEATGRTIGRVPVWGTPDHYPASFILYEEAQAFCEWTGSRLPTEAEWEKAARGTDGRYYPWGDTWDPTRCNSISGGMHQPEPVGSYGSCLSPYGVLDMTGSMWEWCADRYADDYYSRSPSHDPAGAETGHRYVMRGGAWMSQPNWLRTTYRFKASPTSRNSDHGFRCARSPVE